MNWQFRIRQIRCSAGLWIVETRSNEAKNGGRWFNITEGMHKSAAEKMLKNTDELTGLADKVYRHRYSNEEAN